MAIKMSMIMVCKYEIELDLVKANMFEKHLIAQSPLLSSIIHHSVIKLQFGGNI